MSFRPTHVVLTSLPNIPFYLGHNESSGGSADLTRGLQLQQTVDQKGLKKGLVRLRDRENYVYTLNLDEVSAISALQPEFGICGCCNKKVSIDLDDGNLIGHGPQFGICPGSRQSPKEYIIPDKSLPPDPRPPKGVKPQLAPIGCGRCPKFCPYCGRSLEGHNHG